MSCQGSQKSPIVTVATQKKFRNYFKIISFLQFESIFHLLYQLNVFTTYDHIAPSLWHVSAW